MVNDRKYSVNATLHYKSSYITVFYTFIFSNMNLVQIKCSKYQSWRIFECFSEKKALEISNFIQMFRVFFVLFFS